MTSFNYIYLLDQIRAISLEGLKYATNSYDLERYKRLEQLAGESYAELLEIDMGKIREQFQREFGIVTPKIGAEAAIMHEYNEILILKRTDDQKWCLPCGWVNVGESPAEAAVRETKEETGIDVQPLGYIGISHKGPLTGPHLHHQINIITRMKSITRNNRIILSQEHSAYAWIDSNNKIEWHPGHNKQFQHILKCLNKDLKIILVEKE